MPNPARPLKVCCVIGALTSGGSERQMMGILQHLDRQKFTPQLFTFYQHGPLVADVPQDVPHFCYETEMGMPQRGWLPGGVQRQLAARLASYLQEQQIDVVYDRTYHVSLVVGAACRKTSTPYVNTVVENPKLGFYSTAGAWGRLKFYQLRRVYQHAAAVLCVSRELSEYVPKYFQLPNTNFYPCHNFVDQRRWQAILAARSLRMPRTDFSLQNPLQVVAVGRLHWQKGLDTLLRAIATVQPNIPLQLTLVGEGPEEANLRALANQLGLQTQLNFVGWVPEPANLIAAADLFVLPSLGEGLPNSLLEALLIGTPTIASNCDFGPRELTEHGRWGQLVAAGDVLAWAEAIRQFAGDPHTLISTAVAARSKLEQQFSAQSGIRRLEQFLLQAAGYHS